jgi:hypothetical protein
VRMLFDFLGSARSQMIAALGEPVKDSVEWRLCRIGHGMAYFSLGPRLGCRLQTQLL